MRLNLGGGELVHPDFINIDKRPLPSVNILHDLEVFPWPVPDASCEILRVDHLLEHIKPWLTIIFFNEMWRVLKVNGQIILSMPYAGSPEYWQDPTHCNGFTEKTFEYFDLRETLYKVYSPRPWHILSIYKEQFLKVVMQKVES